MVTLIRTTSVYLLVSLLATPVLAADSTLKSSNFTMDDVNFASTTVLTSTQDGVPPTISSQGPQVSNLAPTSVTITWETDKKSTSTVEYGATTAYGQSAGSAEPVTVHSVAIAGLKEETTYHFHVVSEDAFGGTSNSADTSFTTPAATQFQEVSISQVTYTTALVKVVTGGLKTVAVSYGTNASLTENSKQVSTVVTTAENNFPLTGLKPGTKYFIRIDGQDSKGNPAKMSGLTFTTTAEPQLVTFTATATSPNEMTVSVKTSTPTTATAIYRSSLDSQDNSAGDTTLATTHELKLTKLYGATEYKLTVTVTDAGGKRLTSQPLTISTLTDTDPPVLTNPNLNVSRVGDQIMVTARWETNEPVVSSLKVTSKVNPKDSVNIPEASVYSVTQILTASGLVPKTPYVLTAESVDKAGNRSTRQVNFVTPSVRKSILDLISQNLSRLVDPLSNLVNSF